VRQVLQYFMDIHAAIGLIRHFYLSRFFNFSLDYSYSFNLLLIFHNCS